MQNWVPPFVNSSLHLKHHNHCFPCSLIHNVSAGAEQPGNSGNKGKDDGGSYAVPQLPLSDKHPKGGGEEETEDGDVTVEREDDGGGTAKVNKLDLILIICLFVL